MQNEPDGADYQAGHGKSRELNREETYRPDEDKGVYLTTCTAKTKGRSVSYDRTECTVDLTHAV